MNCLGRSSLRIAKYSLVAVAVVTASAFGQSVEGTAERTVFMFLRPMTLLASVDAAVTDASSALALRAVALQRPLGRQEAEARYREGLELAREHDRRSALAAFHEAADGGHGLAQRKLGDIYGTGYDDVERDYQTSLKWYQAARNQGVGITNKPFVYPGYRR
jgi:TPR repeat protein